MLRMTTRLKIAAALVATSFHAVWADDVTLLDTPVKVTATFTGLDEGGYAAQIGVLNGPITQLVHSVLRTDSTANAQRLLRKQVLWRAPYLFVHSSCGGGRGLRCEGEAVFKVTDGVAMRLGDVIGTVSTIYAQGHFIDVYDKLDTQLRLTLQTTPSFAIVLDDVNGKLAVNAPATWSRNAAAWQANADLMANTRPSGGDMAPQYLTALLSNAALARYCNRSEELQALLSMEKLTLSADQMQLVTDTLAKVIPMELPKAWRSPY